VSEEKKEDAAAGGETKPKVPLGPMILLLLNTLAILGALGTFYYTKFLFKKPKITEAQERARLAALAEQAEKNKKPAIPGTVNFETMTVNIEAEPIAGSPEGQKLHFVKMGFTLELVDESLKTQVEVIRPILLDRLLVILAKKPYSELNTVQGRYVLRTELADLANGLLAKETGKRETLVSNVFFHEFTVQ
jgi:flagellar basal body-associated protein FliL